MTCLPLRQAAAKNTWAASTCPACDPALLGMLAPLLARDRRKNLKSLGIVQLIFISKLDADLVHPSNRTPSFPPHHPSQWPDSSSPPSSSASRLVSRRQPWPSPSPRSPRSSRAPGCPRSRSSTLPRRSSMPWARPMRVSHHRPSHHPPFHPRPLPPSLGGKERACDGDN